MFSRLFVRIALALCLTACGSNPPPVSPPSIKAPVAQSRVPSSVGSPAPVAPSSALSTQPSASASVSSPTSANVPTSNLPAGPAAPLTAQEQQEKSVYDQVVAKYPKLKVASVQRVAGLANPALYQVTLSDQIAYTNATVDFFFVGGELIVGSGATLTNVTKSTALSAGSKMYQSMPINRALKYVYGDGSRQMVVFSDPDCPFCQQLEVLMRQNADNLNATVYLLPYALDAVHPQADAKARHILCTKDPASAWQNWMLTAAATPTNEAQQAAWPAWAARNPAVAGCKLSANIDAIKKFGRDLGVNQTPTLMFSNGMPWYGILSRSELEQAWAYVKSNPVPPSLPTATSPTAH